MRIKADFVTNSSSTGFILHGKLCGMIDRPMCLQRIRNILEGKHNTKYHSEKYESFSYEFGLENCYDDDGGKCQVSLRHGAFYKDDGDDINVTFVEAEVEGRSVGPQTKDSFVRKQFKRILEAILDMEEKDPEIGEFSYNQFPEPFGDGLDGGDPQGYYKWSKDIYLNETLNGEIRIKGKKAFLKLKGEQEEGL